MTTSAVIRSVGHYVPSRRVTNADLVELMDTTDEWIRERTGIRERRFIEAPGVKTSDLGYEAAVAALQSAGWKAADVDCIVAATLSPDLYFPGIGTILQHRLGCRNIPAFDIRAQCSGFVYGVSAADAFIRSGQAKRVLLICAEVQSPLLDLTTRGRDMAVLFGDGAAAAAIEAVESAERPTAGNDVRGVIDSMLGSDGSGAETLCVRLPGTANPGFLHAEDVSENRVRPEMDGKLVFKNAVTRMVETASSILERNGIGREHISLLVPHQANLRINEYVREHLKLSPEQVFNNIERYGNTTAATIPIALSEAVTAGRLLPGSLVLTLAFGAGFTWGGNLIRW